MTVRFLGNNILIRDGNIALHEDCCCTPPCLPCTDICRTCYYNSCNDCLQIDYVTIDIDGVATPENSKISTCVCENVNVTFTIDVDGKPCCNPTGATLLDCQWYINPYFPIQSKYKVFIQGRMGFAQNTATFTQGTFSYPYDLQGICLPISRPDYTRICNNFTFYKGHYVLVNFTLSDWFLGNPDNNLFFFQKFTYAFSFNNKLIMPDDCPPDQFLGDCSLLSGGQMTLLLKENWWGLQGNCDDGIDHCLFQNAVLTVNNPVLYPLQTC